MSMKLSGEELTALKGLSHLQRCVYIFGIRQYMNFKTGIVGIERGISYQSISEELYVDKTDGLKAQSFSHDQVKRALSVLEKKKLISRKSIVTKHEKRLILECLLAQTDGSVKKGSAPSPPRPSAPEDEFSLEQENTINIDMKSELKEVINLEVRPDHFSRSAPPPVSVVLNTNKDLSNHEDLSSFKHCSKKKFEHFWEVYPKKVGKIVAERSWKRKKLEDKSEILIADVLKRIRDDFKWQKGFIPNPATYLNQERWNDEISQSTKNDEKEMSVRDKNAAFFDRCFEALQQPDEVLIEHEKN